MKLRLFFLIALSVSISSCCKKELPDPPSDALTCPKGFEVQGDSCFCPPENWVLDKECRPLGVNEYYGVVPNGLSCWGGDTLVIRFDWDNSNAYFSNRERTTEEGLGIKEIAMGVDSFYTRRVNAWFTLLGICDINGERATGQIVGLKTTEDTIFAKLYLRSYATWYETILDSCDLTLLK